MSHIEPLKNRIGAHGTPKDRPGSWPLLLDSILRALESHPDARLALAEALKQEIEPEPCPTCGRR